MKRAFRRILGVAGIGLSWSVAWLALFGTLALIVAVVRPQDFDPGETSMGIAGRALIIGFVSGAIFGTILSLAENRKAVPDLGLIRVALWGALAAAMWPLVTEAHDNMIMITSPFGAICAAAAVAIARNSELPGRARIPKWIGRLFGKPLQAACAS